MIPRRPQLVRLHLRLQPAAKGLQRLRRQPRPILRRAAL
jgi:hypothetical protein